MPICGDWRVFFAQTSKSPLRPYMLESVSHSNRFCPLTSSHQSPHTRHFRQSKYFLEWVPCSVSTKEDSLTTMCAMVKNDDKWTYWRDVCEFAYCRHQPFLLRRLLVRSRGRKMEGLVPVSTSDVAIACRFLTALRSRCQTVLQLLWFQGISREEEW